MNDDIEFESITVKAGRRTYFIDVKQSKTGSKYVKITESKRIGDGEFERHDVIIYEEDIDKIVVALDKVIHHFSSAAIPVTKSRMEQLKEKYTNAYLPWTEDDDNILTTLFHEGKKVGELVDFFQRNRGAINSRIRKLGLK